MKLAGALLLVFAGAAFTYAQYQKVRPASLDERANQTQELAAASPPAPLGSPSREERQAMRQEMFKALDLSPEQQRKIEELAAEFDRQGDPQDNFRGRMRAMREVLTEEQEAKARELMPQMMRSRMQERLKMLPAEEREKFMEKFEERRAQWEERRATGEGPRWGGAPGGRGGAGEGGGRRGGGEV
ncbi:MAG: hypothetical protein RLY93_06900 [Sumerlaeia bacterium]